MKIYIPQIVNNSIKVIQSRKKSENLLNRPTDVIVLVNKPPKWSVSID